MQCPSCRQEASGAFCNFCGATLAVAPAGAGAATVPASTTGAGLSPNAAAAIAYLTIIPSIVFLVLEPYKSMRLVRFHSIQNIVLAVAWIVAYVALTILGIVMHFIPLFGIVIALLDMGIGVLFFVAWLIALIKASRGEYFKLPLIGDFCARQAGV